MNTCEIVCSKNHLTAPFTLPDRSGVESAQFTTMEKVASIALSLLIGVFTMGVGGVIVFYLITAAMKAKKLSSQSSPANQPPVGVSHHSPNNSRAVRFGGVKQREFDSAKPSADVGNVNSIEINSVQASNSHQGGDSSYPTSIHDRRFPPLSLFDTVYGTDNQGRAKSAHPEGVKFYRDTEILTLHASIREIHLGNNIIADLTDNNKIVIQQQATRGCTAAVAAMLIYDVGKSIDLSSLEMTNLGTTDSIKRLITRAGLTPRVGKISLTDNQDTGLYNLKTLIETHGSAIVTTDNDIRGHVIVVDAITDDLSSVRLRDPYHGWSITVTQSAFLRGFLGGDIIQIVD